MEPEHSEGNPADDQHIKRTFSSKSKEERPRSGHFVETLNTFFFEFKILAYRSQEGFLILNDECLENILKYLKDEDLVNFALAHPRIMHIVLSQSPRSIYFEKLSDLLEYEAFGQWLKDNINLFLDFSNDFWLNILLDMNGNFPKADFIFFANASPRIRELAIGVFSGLEDDLCALDCGKSILMLNNDCLEHILKYVIYNCGLIRDYTDLINFGLAHPRINDIALALTPNNPFLDSMMIDYNDCSIQSWCQTTNAIRSCTLIYDVEKNFVPEYVEYFQKIMNGLHPDLENLQILNTGYSVDNLHRFTRLRKLRISADISADVLVECCKANPDLEIINLLGSTIYGKLADIVPYCNKLLDLSITLKANAVEYVHLAKLPHLKYLRLNGQHDIGSLQQVFRAFASNESQILKWLYVEPLINFDETKELIGIRSLSKLEYSYNDIRSLVALSQLNNLRTLQVKNTHSFPYQPVAGNEIIEAFLIILQRCRKLEVFFLHWYIEKHFISNVGELLKKVRDPETQLSLKLIGYENTKFITEKDKKMWKKLYGKYMRVILANRSNFKDKTESETPPSPPPPDLYYG